MTTNRKRRSRYKFTEKKHSKKGMIATAISVAIIVLFFIFIRLSFESNGNLSLYYGSIGVLAIFVDVIAIVLSAQGMKEENSFMLFPRLAFILSILGEICWVGTYVIGYSI